MAILHGGRIDAAPAHSKTRPVPGAAPGPETGRKRPSAGRALRLAVGLGLIALPALFLAPTLWSVTSARAVVNARLITVRSPLEGIVADRPPDVMQPVSKGEPLLTVDPGSIDRGHLEELRAEEATLTERVAALRAHREGLNALREELRSAFRRYQDSMIGRGTRELEEARYEATAAGAELRLRVFEEGQEAALLRRGYGCARELTQARTAAEVARARAGRATVTVARLEEQLEAVRRGVFTGPGDGRNDVPYSRQRIHEIALQQLHDEAQIREHLVRLAEVGRQVRSEVGRYRRRGDGRVNAPVDGIVWRRFVDAGSAVGLQAALLEVVDRSALFIDAVVTARYVDDIRVGDKAVVRPYGSPGGLAGVVRCVLGEEVPDEGLAMRSPRLDRDQIHVLIDLARGSPPAGADGPGRLRVGQRVEVEFPEAARSVLGLR